MSDAVIDVRNVGRRFGQRWVLRNVDLSATEGAVCGLLGRNGAGKTTLIRMMMGFLRVHEGTITVAGAAPFRDQVALRRVAGFAGEDLRLPAHWRVSELLAFGAAAYDDWDQKRAEKLRAQFGLPPDRRVRELSVGMAAKLGLILPLARRPRVLLLDEPFGGLDVVVRREVLEGVIEVIPEVGATVLVSSHLVHELERLADRVAILTGGRITYSGGVEDLMASVRRIHLAPDAAPPDLRRWPWIRRTERRGSIWTLTVFDYSPGRLEELSAAGCTVQDIEALSLEEIAIEYLREDRFEEGAA